MTGHSTKFWLAVSTLTDDAFDIATAFNQHFTKVKSTDSTAQSSHCHSVFNKLKEFVSIKLEVKEPFTFLLMDTEFVCKQLSRLQINEARGANDINPHFL